MTRPADAQTIAAVPSPAGWYPDTTGRPQQRYWDGSQWTTHFAPPTPAPDPGRSSGLYALGLITAIFIPVIGFILGIVLVARRQDTAGLIVVVVSIVMGVLALLVLGSRPG